MSELVFVYGTLRRGEVNHFLIETARFLGRHQTLPRFRMLHLGAYPGVVERGATAITGEVYQINARQLAGLDKLEAYPTLYTRKLIPTPWGRAWIYLYRGARTGKTLIPCGDWRGKTRQIGAFSLY